MNHRSTLLLEHHLRECRHIHRHSRESGNPKAIGSKCVFASYRIPGSRFRGDDGNRRLETDILKLTTLPKELKLPSFLREYGKMAAQCAAEGVDHPQYLLRLAELELIDRHQRMVERRIGRPDSPP